MTRSEKISRRLKNTAAIKRVLAEAGVTDRFGGAPSVRTRKTQDGCYSAYEIHAGILTDEQKTTLEGYGWEVARYERGTEIEFAIIHAWWN